MDGGDWDVCFDDLPQSILLSYNPIHPPEKANMAGKADIMILWKYKYFQIFLLVDSVRENHMASFFFCSNLFSFKHNSHLAVDFHTSDWKSMAFDIHEQIPSTELKFFCWIIRIDVKCQLTFVITALARSIERSWLIRISQELLIYKLHCFEISTHSEKWTCPPNSSPLGSAHSLSF